MAIVRDIMPAFELFQPATTPRRPGFARPLRPGCVGAGRRTRQLRLAERSDQAAQGGDRSEPDQRAPRRARDKRRPRDWRDDHVNRGRAPSGRAREIQHSIALAPKQRPRRRSATRERSAATCRKTRAAGITAAAGNAIARAETSASPIRRPRSIASTPSSAPTAAWP